MQTVWGTIKDACQLVDSEQGSVLLNQSLLCRHRFLDPLYAAPIAFKMHLLFNERSHMPIIQQCTFQ